MNNYFGTLLGIIITIFIIGHQYNKHDERIKTLESHTDTLAKMVQAEQYQLDVISEWIKAQK